MTRNLPEWLPVCRVRGGTGFPLDSLFGKVVERLSRQGMRAAVLENTGLGTQADIAERLQRAAVISDVVFDLNGVLPWTGADLRLGAEPDDGDSQTEAGVQLVCREQSDLEDCCSAILRWLDWCCRRTPLHGCILIGGKSTRMGRPKHLLRGGDGLTWLDRTRACLTPFISKCVLSGAGFVPPSCEDLERLDDVPGLAGPLAGLGAALRDGGPVTWLVAACDMPDISPAALRWLLEQRRSGSVAVIPRNPLTGRAEPLLAVYDFRCLPLLEQLLADGIQRISRLGDSPLVLKPEIPEELAGCWRNVNRPADL